MTNTLKGNVSLAHLSMGKPAIRRKDVKITEEVAKIYKVRAKAGLYSKELLTEGALDKTTRIQGRARTLINSRTGAWMDNGPRIIPNTLIIATIEDINSLNLEHQSAVDEACAAYPGMVDQRRIELNGMFNEADYPPVEIWRTKFYFKLHILPLPDTDDFRCKISDEALEQIKAGYADQLKTAEELTKKLPADKIMEVVGHMAKMLGAYKPGEDGKRAESAFRQSLVDNVRELCMLLPHFNIGNDPQLVSVIARMEKELCAEDEPALKKDEILRETVRKSAEDILTEVSQFI